MRYPTIPTTLHLDRGGAKPVSYSWKQFMDEFILMDRRWSKEPKFRETFDRAADLLADAPEGSVVALESQDFENFCEVMQDWPPQGLQAMPDIVRPTRRMINQFCSAPTSDPRAIVKVEVKNEESGT